ncbi:hypothetical protein BpsM61_00008 [Bacillus phage vB_BpsM-61]|nr:hypothetical protein BpsM61_00008 [Bacillus phage vB_BpsM-61]
MKSSFKVFLAITMMVIGFIGASELVKPGSVKAAMVHFETWGHSYSNGTLEHMVNIGVDSTVNHEGRIAHYYFKDADANVIRNGSSEMEFYFNDDEQGIRYWNSKPVTSVLRTWDPGTYELLYTYQAGGKQHRSSIFFEIDENKDITVNR